MGLAISIETRTGDTPQHKRRRQAIAPPDILLTTPEQVALLIAYRDARRFFSQLRMIVVDELHALTTSKRGDLLALGIARLRTLAPGLQTIGLSATVAEPDDLRAWLSEQSGGAEPVHCDLITVAGGAKPDIRILTSQQRLPWAGHSARYALPELYEAIKTHKTTLIFVNTRSQAEMLFQELWRINRDNLAIALHHGSLDVGRRAQGRGGDDGGGRCRRWCVRRHWILGSTGVMSIWSSMSGRRRAPAGWRSGSAGRTTGWMNRPRALLVPANRFEVLECQAALDANYVGAQDTPPARPGALDVLAQHVLGMAVAAPFSADRLFTEVTTAAPYHSLDRATFDQVVDFVATGGYALGTYERFARIRKTGEGLWRVSHPKIAQQYRLNVGTIVEAPLLKVRLASRRRGGTIGRGGRVLGEIEEAFIEALTPGDTFLFAGEVLRFEAIRENEAIVSRSAAESPRIPAYAGGKFPLSTFLADSVRAMLADPESWKRLPDPVRQWLELQRDVSLLPAP